MISFAGIVYYRLCHKDNSEPVFLLIAFVCNEVFFLSEQNVEGKACKLKITVRHFYHFHMVSW